MLNFNTILFPIDFSDRCRLAAPYVQSVAARFNSRLILLHVLETSLGQPGDLDFGGLAASLQWEDRSQRTKELLDNFLKDQTGDLRVERRLENGDPARCIVNVANEVNADLVMMPTHGYGGFRRFILGSVTAKVLHDVACPVWTGVHLEQAPAIDAMSVRRIMCALDLTPLAESVLRAGAQLAAEYGAELMLIHAVPGSEAIPEKMLDCELRRHLIAEARDQLQALATKVGVTATICADGGDVAKVVDGCARQHKADLVVIGRGQHTGFGRLRTHSYAIIRDSPCPVLSI